MSKAPETRCARTGVPRALFLASQASGQPLDYIVGAEIYDHLEKVVDRFEDVANHISGILIENL